MADLSPILHHFNYIYFAKIVQLFYVNDLLLPNKCQDFENCVFRARVDRCNYRF